MTYRRLLFAFSPASAHPTPVRQFLPLYGAQITFWMIQKRMTSWTHINQVFPHTRRGRLSHVNNSNTAFSDHSGASLTPLLPVQWGLVFSISSMSSLSALFTLLTRASRWKISPGLYLFQFFPSSCRGALFDISPLLQHSPFAGIRIIENFSRHIREIPQHHLYTYIISYCVCKFVCIPGR